MNLGNIRARLRERNAWEAMDLGLRMTQHWAGAIWRPWIVLLVPLWLLTSLLLLVQPMWLVALTLWWMKPLYDRLPLFVLSQALFGRTPGISETITATTRSWREDAFMALTWQRFNPSRSFVLPVRRLEGLTGEQRSRRISALSQGANEAGNAVWLTMSFWHFELILWVGILALLQFLVPQGVELDLFEGWDAGLVPAWLEALQLAIWLLAVTLLEPFYVAAGFSLYLNRRSRLEGWDLELAFRQMQAHHAEKSKSRRQKTGSGRSPLLLLPLVFSLLLAGAGFNEAWASEPPTQVKLDKKPLSNSANDSNHESGYQPAETIEQQDELGTEYDEDDEDWVKYGFPHSNNYNSGGEIDCSMLAQRITALQTSEHAAERELGSLMSEEAFKPCESDTVWKMIDKPDEDDDEEELDLDFWESLFGFGEGLGGALQALLWVMVIGLIGFLLFIFLRHYDPSSRSSRGDNHEEPPAQLFGLDLRPESLPDDIPATAKALWLDGQHRAAMALLYRGSLSRLAHEHAVTLDKSLTEGDCLQAVHQQIPDQPALIEYFDDLTNCWIQIAYAEREPAEASVMALFADWSRLMEAGASAEAAEA